MNYSILTKKEKDLAEYIFKNYNTVPDMSISQLGEAANILMTGITRFVKKTGYINFVSFKMELLKECIEKEEEIEVFIKKDDSLQNICDKAYNDRLSVIKDCFSLLNLYDIQRTINLIVKAENIYLYEIGAPGLVAQDFQYKMTRINKKATYFYDSNMQMISSLYSTEKDVAIGISYSGQSKEIKIAFTKAKENGAKCIAITSNIKSSIRSMADIVIPIPYVEKN